MSTKPEQITINVRAYGGTYIATSKEAKMRASCTEGERSAAHACAYKVYGTDGFTLKQVSDKTWNALRVDAPARPVSAWRLPSDHPDVDIIVIIRTTDEDDPIYEGFFDGISWDGSFGSREDKPAVTGWMYIEDAARILDAATL